LSEKHWKCDHCKHENDKHRKNCERCNGHYRWEHDEHGEEDKHKKMLNKDDLKDFRYDEPRSVPMQDAFKRVRRGEEDVLAKIKFCPKHDKDHDHKDKCNKLHAVWLAATVGWRANRPLVSDGLIVLFRIRKGSEDGEVIFATRQGVGVDVQELRAETTTFIHVDELFKNKFTSCDDDDHETKYFLTAEVVANDPNDVAVIVGPVVFTAAKIG
jgi:DnaJ-class molecular chaperone